MSFRSISVFVTLIFLCGSRGGGEGLFVGGNETFTEHRKKGISTERMFEHENGRSREKRRNY